MDSFDSVAEKVWNGTIPVCFRLSPDELTDEISSPPPPFYMLVPRVTYFPLVLEKIIRQMRNCFDSALTRPRTISSSVNKSCNSLTAQSSEDIPLNKREVEYWLACDTVPLKWHYPVGLLFDLYGSLDQLPWEITVHFEGYPTDVLLAPPVSRAAVEAVFFSGLKEADQLKHRGRGASGPVFVELLPQQQRDLWLGLARHRFDLFWPLNRRFMQGSATRAATHHKKPAQQQQVAGSTAADGDKQASQDATTHVVGEDAGALLQAATSGAKTFRHCPMRLYFAPCAAPSAPPPPTATHLQTLISAFNEGDDGQYSTPATFADAIKVLFASARNTAVPLKIDDFSFLVHGIEVPLDTPVQWLCEWMAYPDNFVHVVARRN